MSTLERHCQLLLRAYPAAYLEVRGEEIIGTLLEATPPGRSWPLRRDIRGLVTGGLRARATLNRRRTTVANLREAALVGVASSLAFIVVGYVNFVVATEVALGGSTEFLPYSWPVLLSLPLTAASVVLALTSRRRIIVLATALPAVGLLCYAGPWRAYLFTQPIVQVAFLAVLIVLVGGPERPDRRWLWPVGFMVVSQLLGGIHPGFWAYVHIGGLLAIVVLSLAWLPIDARPAIALAVLLLAYTLPAEIDDFAGGVSGLLGALLLLLIVSAVAVPAFWLLRRQSAHPGRPTQT